MEKQRLLKKLPFLALLPGAFLLSHLAQCAPGFIERVYSGGVYHALNTVFSWVFSVFPFSVAEFLVYAVVLAALFAVGYAAAGLILRRTGLKKLLNWCVSALILLGIIINAFYLLWGFNYAREPLAKSLQLAVEPRPSAELEALCMKLASEANALRSALPEDENGVFVLADGWREEFKKIPDAFSALGKRHELFARRIPAAKGVLASRGMSYAGISGVYFPFTAEANVNVDGPPLLFAAAAAHESAHMQGVAREDEANFVAYLACIHSDAPSVRYSGVMLALIHSGNALYETDKAAHERVAGRYSSAVLRDIISHSQFVRAFEGPISETVNTVNDAYLRTNYQREGVKSYGRMVDLLLAYE